MNGRKRGDRRGAARLLAVAAVGVFFFAGVAVLKAATPAKGGEVLGRKAPDFRLKDQDGKQRTLAEFSDKKALVVIFTGNDCPISNAYVPTLNDLAAKFGGRGAQFLAVNANPEETFETVAQHAKEYKYAFPVLKDDRQTLADALGAKVTPEAFVLDQGRAVRYHGRIDDSYASRTQKRSQTGDKNLENALEAVLAGKPVAQPATLAIGCAIVRPDKTASKTTGPTFYKDVLPILQDNCQSCHRPNQVAPFPLLTYQDAKSWAAEIKTFTLRRIMPPWKAEPGHGDFMDPRRLSDKQLDTLVAWSDSGAPAGNKKDAPVAKVWADDWTLGKPDLVLTMPEEYTVAATGADDFRCFALPTNLTEDKQVVAVEVRPGNPRVVHHVLNFLDTSGKGRELDAKDPGPGYNSGPGGVGFFPSGALGGWAPGNMPRVLPDGIYRPLPAKSDMVIQVHYHKTGKVEKDRTSIGVYFAKEPRMKQARTLPLTNLAINIPPDEAKHEVKAQMTVPFDATAISITPHMHLLGREMKVAATLPDGSTKDMVWVRDWDYRWQDTYLYKEPFRLPKGTKLELTAYYDNTSGNPLNPNNPPKRVTFGEQTTDEMCFAFIDFVMDAEPPAFRAGKLFGR